MYLFKYIYYRYMSYTEKRIDIEKSEAELSFVCILTFFQIINVAALLFFLFPVELIFFLGKLNPILFGVLGVVPLLFNKIIFFNKKKLSKYKERWDGEEKRIRKIKGVLIIIYMIASLILFVLAISTL